MRRVIQIIGFSLVVLSIIIYSLNMVEWVKSKSAFIVKLGRYIIFTLPLGIFLFALSISGFIIAFIITLITGIILRLGGMI